MRRRSLRHFVKRRKCLFRWHYSFKVRETGVCLGPEVLSRIVLLEEKSKVLLDPIIFFRKVFK